MFEFIENARLKISQAIDWKRLQKQRDEELKVLRQKKQFEISKTDLEREAELEELKANIRKEQQKSLPKKGQVQEKKTGFAKFQNYCTNFANQPSFIGDIKLGGKNGKRRHKKGSKRSGAGIAGRYY